MNNTLVVTIVFVLLLVFLANPFGFWMPSALEQLTIAALTVVAAVFAGLVTGEKARDEREEEIRAHSARAGYLAGIFILTLGTAIPVVVGGHPNIWVLIALGVMVVVRFISHRKSE